MTIGIQAFHTAIALLKEEGVTPLVAFPAEQSDIKLLEQRLGVPVPKSYAEMLRTYGVLMVMGQTVFGIGRAGVDTEGGSGVLFQTRYLRERNLIPRSMIRIMSAGYGPNICLDTSETGSDGEAPVYLVPADGDMEGAELLAPSFGEFLLNEAKAYRENPEI